MRKTLKFKDESKYVGEVKNGKPHGKGILIYPENGGKNVTRVAPGHAQKMVKKMVAGCPWTGAQQMVLKWSSNGPCLGGDHSFTIILAFAGHQSKGTP